MFIGGFKMTSDSEVCANCGSSEKQWIPNGGSGYYRCKKCKCKSFVPKKNENHKPEKSDEEIFLFEFKNKWKTKLGINSQIGKVWWDKMVEELNSLAREDERKSKEEEIIQLGREYNAKLDEVDNLKQQLASKDKEFLEIIEKTLRKMEKRKQRTWTFGLIGEELKNKIECKSKEQLDYENGKPEDYQ